MILVALLLLGIILLDVSLGAASVCTSHLSKSRSLIGQVSVLAGVH